MRPTLSQASPTSLLGRLRALCGDRRGVAAIEFAFVVPVLLTMYFITMEASQGLQVNRKVSRIGSMVADLITQQTAISKAEVVAIMDIGKSLILPYGRSVPQLEVTAIQFDNNESSPTARALWSVKLGPAGAAVKVVDKNSQISDPRLADIRAPGAFYIRVTSKLAYKPVITWSPDASSVGLLSAFNNIDMGETFYLRPRYASGAIPCADCP